MEKVERRASKWSHHREETEKGPENSYSRYPVLDAGEGLFTRLVVIG